MGDALELEDVVVQSLLHPCVLVFRQEARGVKRRSLLEVAWHGSGHQLIDDLRSVWLFFDVCEESAVRWMFAQCEVRVVLGVRRRFLRGAQFGVFILKIGVRTGYACLLQREVCRGCWACCS